MKYDKIFGKSYGSRFLIIVAICSSIIALLICASFLIRPFYPLEIYDVEIRVHYVDGSSEVIRKDSIMENELPRIEEGYAGFRYRHRLGTYSLYFGQKRYHGIFKFEYLKKRKYSIDYSSYMESRW